MPVYIVIQIFLAGGWTIQPGVIHEVLAVLKTFICQNLLQVMHVMSELVQRQNWFNVVRLRDNWLTCIQILGSY